MEELHDESTKCWKHLLINGYGQIELLEWVCSCGTKNRFENVTGMKFSCGGFRFCDKTGKEIKCDKVFRR